MKKRMMIILLSAAMAVSAAACGNGKKESKDSSESGSQAQAVSDEATYDLDKDVKLGKYMGLKVSLTDTYKVTSAQVEEYANNVMQYYAKPSYKDTDKTTVEDGDTVNIDYTGKRDGVAFDGGTASDQYLKIGSDSFIDGFEDGLIGKKVGETVDLNLTFPENYHSEELAGADVVFTVTIHKIVEEDASKQPELTDEFVKENFNYENVKEFKKELKKDLKSMNENTKTSDTRKAVLEKLQEDCEVTISDALLNARTDQYVQIFENNNVTEEGATLESYLKDNYSGMSVDEFHEKVMTDMESSLKTELILEAIAKKESIEVDENEFKEYVQQQMSSNGCETEEDFYLMNGVDAQSGEQYTRKIFLGTKVLDVIVENADVKYGVEEEEDTEENADAQKDAKEE